MPQELMYVGDDPEIVGGDDDEIVGADEESALAEIFGADPRRRRAAAGARPGAGQVLVRTKSADSVYNEWLPLPATVIAAGATVEVEPRPVRTFRLEQLQVYGGGGLSLVNFLVDQDSIFAGVGEVPLGLLGGDSTLRLKSRTVSRGSVIILQIKNFSVAEVTVRGVLSGTVLR